jgi:hypothetical protein
MKIMKYLVLAPQIYIRVLRLPVTRECSLFVHFVHRQSTRGCFHYCCGLAGTTGQVPAVPPVAPQPAAAAVPAAAAAPTDILPAAAVAEPRALPGKSSSAAHNKVLFSFNHSVVLLLR